MSREKAENGGISGGNAPDTVADSASIKGKRERGEIALTQREHSHGYTYIIYNRENKREEERGMMEMIMRRTRERMERMVI